jgi:hypothetical protein
VSEEDQQNKLNYLSLLPDKNRLFHLARPWKTSSFRALNGRPQMQNQKNFPCLQESITVNSSEDNARVIHSSIQAIEELPVELPQFLYSVLSFIGVKQKEMGCFCLVMMNRTSLTVLQS